MAGHHPLAQFHSLTRLPAAGFMEEVIRGMAGHVPLKAIAEAIIHHYSGDAFGDFKVGRGGVARCFFSVCCRLQSGRGGKAIAEAIVHHCSCNAFGDFKVGRGGVARC